MLRRECVLWHDIESKITHPLDRAIVWYELKRVYSRLGPTSIISDRVLLLAFPWVATPQGDDFWRNVYYERVDTSTIRRS